MNRHDPEKGFIAKALSNTYWLREKIRSLLAAEVWITPIIVFTNAFVERMAPIKWRTIINKKYLLNTLQKPHSEAQNLAVWENREKIRNALYP